MIKNTLKSVLNTNASVKITITHNSSTNVKYNSASFSFEADKYNFSKQFAKNMRAYSPYFWGKFRAVWRLDDIDLLLRELNFLEFYLTFEVLENVKEINELVALQKIGLNIMKHRRRRGFKQRDVEAAIGIGVATQGHYEAGRREQKIKDLVKYAKLFGVPLHELLKH